MFQIPCPNCGLRNVQEFHFSGERLTRPSGKDEASWTDYLYKRHNTLGVQTEWWFHRLGCRRWFLVRRHTASNQVLESFWPHEHPSPQSSTQPGS